VLRDAASLHGASCQSPDARELGDNRRHVAGLGRTAADLRVRRIGLGDNPLSWQRLDDAAPVPAAQHRRVDRKVEAGLERALDRAERARVPVQDRRRAGGGQEVDRLLLGLTRMHRQHLSAHVRQRQDRLENVALTARRLPPLLRVVECSTAISSAYAVTAAVGF
jgi:hypothetical protein